MGLQWFPQPFVLFVAFCSDFCWAGFQQKKTKLRKDRFAVVSTALCSLRWLLFRFLLRGISTIENEVKEGWVCSGFHSPLFSSLPSVQISVGRDFNRRKRS